MLEFLLDYVNTNFVLILLALITLLTLTMKPKVSNVDFRPMYITVISILLFTVLDRMETLITDNPACYAQRLFLSIVCYWLRPIFCLGLIFVIASRKKERLLVLIPELINILVMGAAWIPGVGKYVFYFDDDFCFQRGPLGYTVFVVGFLYLIILIYFVFFRLREKKAKENLLVSVFCLCIVVSTIVEAAGYIHNTTPTLVVVGCLFYYLTIYFQLTSVDALTGLYNREIFYQDSQKRNISAVVSIDMNGLKEINDEKGHKAGDIALTAIADVIKKHVHGESRGYRIGGDEFLIIFIHMKEEAVKKACDRIRSDVEQAGYSAAVGYAYCFGETTEELVKISDDRMYLDKDAHYGRTGNRR